MIFMGETKLDRVAAYVDPHTYDKLNKICEQKGCTMSFLIARIIENQLSSADSADSFSSSDSLAESAQNTLLENQVKSLQTNFGNLQAVVAELRNNPGNELTNSAGSAMTQLAHQLAQLGENPRNKPEFQYFQDSQAQASSADLDDSAVTQLKRNRNKLETENENLQAELEEAYEELREAFQEISHLKAERYSLRLKAIEKDLSTLSDHLKHAEEKKLLISELEKYKSALAEHQAWVKSACEFYKIPG